jgi:2-polyprenyl-3-methyl-5-hydroxy-6-metoxy-1,4-benzoquinol methylase
MVTQLNNTTESTAGADYTNRLVRLETAWWKRVLDVQAPYRWNLQRLRPGFTLEVGCGVGRNLKNLLNDDGSNAAVGVDHNETSVRIARERGLLAYTADAGMFDTLLLAHVAEHMTMTQCVDLISAYRKYLKKGARLILITPQEAGFRSDSTHVVFMDFERLNELETRVGTTPLKHYSFPFPRLAGKFFKYNEFVTVSSFP